jgi:hypothetical protein
VKELRDFTTDCTDDVDDSWNVSVPRDPDALPDFSEAWEGRYPYCETFASLTPETELERKAFKKSGYSERDISTLYDICATVDSEDHYVAADTVLSKEQRAELKGALTLCPDHPQAKKFKASLERTEEDAEPTYEEMFPVAVESCIDVMIETGINTRRDAARQACELAMDPANEGTHWMIDQYYTQAD